MEAAPKLPMLSFELNTCTENVHFGPQLKQYIAAFYGEDPESYITEISNLESLRSAAVRPSTDVNGVQLLKKYFCQLRFLKSRFPMEENQDAAVLFSWKNNELDITSTSSDIRYELMVIMYNIGALHTFLGANDSRNNPDGMKMACTHFQCAAWAFQNVKEKYHQFISNISLVELVHFFQQVCLAQAQECILEKSMFDNRKPTIIAKVAIQVYSYYRQSLRVLESVNEAYFRDKTYKEWMKYLQFKLTYYKCISFLFQGQQAEEQQKMGERVAFYQAACEQLDEAKKIAATLKNQHHQQEINEGLAFTTDVVEGKRKAAKNENEFIYHESVPDKDQLPEVKGASLVKGIPFSINDIEVSGPDIFSRLVPMEAHEAASLYSEKKAQRLRQIGELIENKDQTLAEFMSSMQLDLLTKMHQATGIPQELIDRAAALSAKPNAIQDLISAMGKLSNIYQDVEASLNEIDSLLKAEEQSEQKYQETIGKRPPSILATDLTREAAKYREAHTKANDSNQTLHRAMMAHVANLKILQQPLKQLQHQLPFVEFPNPNIDEKSLKDLEALVAKVDEMRTQRAMLWAQLRESIHQDDITSSLVTKQPNQSLEQLFQQELQKHQNLISLIEQNTSAQENIKSALVDSYAYAVNSRKYIQDILQKRTTTITSLIASFDSYEDLLAKANKGIEFYSKLETNVSKLLQRIRSTCKVQQEERDQMMSTAQVPQWESHTSLAAPKLKDYLDSRKKSAAYSEPSVQPQQPTLSYSAAMDLPPGIRPTPVGSEITDVPKNIQGEPQGYIPYNYQQPSVPASQNIDEETIKKMNALMPGAKTSVPSQYGYSNYIPPTYPQSAYQPGNQSYGKETPDINSPYDPTKAFTATTNAYRSVQSSSTQGYVPYAESNVSNVDRVGYPSRYQYQQVPEIATTPADPNINAYYPHGYSPSQNLPNANTQHITGQLKYHSVEYASSVPNNINYNSSTYSSPLSNMSSTNSSNPSNLNNSYEYYYDPNTSSGAVPNASKPQQSSASSANPSTAMNNYNYYYNTSTSGSVAADTSKIQQQQQYPGTQMSQAQYYPANASYYSTSTYNTNVQGGTNPSYATGQTYNQVTPVTSQNVSQNYNFNQVGSGAGHQHQYYSSANAAVPSQQAVNNSSLPNYGYDQYYGNNYNSSQPSTYSANQAPPAAQAAPSNIPAATKSSSNVDLLSGLDFSISQAPLVPQQNITIKPQEKETKPPAVSSETKNQDPTPVTTPKQPTGPEVKRLYVKILPSKPLNNDDVKKLFGQELDRYEKFVETLTHKTLSGPTTLDIKWKEIQDQQDCEPQKKIISVARCYPMKNRFPDILPYDFSRVELCDSKDDYINASYIKDISPYAPSFIVTQVPLSSTVGDMWTMIREQQVELILCLVNDNEIGEDIYWPKEKGSSLNILNMVITLQNVIVKSHWTERLIAINLPEKRESRVIMHLQFTSWPGSLFPTNPEPFVSYTLESINLYQQQKTNTHPVVVHCSSGIGRSGLLCLLTAAMFDAANNANSIPDLTALSIKLSNCRKNILRDREHLKFGYESFLAYIRHIVCEDKARKKLNEIQPKVKEEPLEPPVIVPEPNIDPLSTLDPFWASKR
ncbi:tyrosine-protein phosphatase non-receptor type 23 [Diabrotica virgifera virgifera]|uniref:Tyrosine-protein phosphatase non-receptor type 23 n=1 Tax=Diabrotica virgifera virgifera TaxID=50390 RepID=A0ABM5L361_DIAVI|nr:tyrosine-protein phosphatase non-receptor type 23 [Diabrotica virgifera virgifera]